MIHKDILIKFEVEGVCFKAVGFLEKGNLSVSGDEMLRRVSDAIGEEDGKFLDECVSQDWSRDLWLYRLATAKLYSDGSRRILYFSRYNNSWNRSWGRLGGSWGKNSLVICRCA